MSKFRIEFEGCSGCPCCKEVGIARWCGKEERYLGKVKNGYPDWCSFLPKTCKNCRFWATWENEDIGACLRSCTCGGTCVSVYPPDHTCDKFERREK